MSIVCHNSKSKSSRAMNAVYRKTTNRGTCTEEHLYGRPLGTVPEITVLPLLFVIGLFFADLLAVVGGFVALKPFFKALDCLA